MEKFGNRGWEILHGHTFRRDTVGWLRAFLGGFVSSASCRVSEPNGDRGSGNESHAGLDDAAPRDYVQG